MIEVTTNINLKAFAKAKAERPWYRTIAPGQLKIVPRRPPHSAKTVTFEKRGRAIFATCRSYHTNEDCQANGRGVWCFHVAWACQVILRQQQRARKEAA